MATITNEMERLALSLPDHTITPGNKIQVTQIEHRLVLFATWLGSFEDAEKSMRSKKIVEIGCGQGDCTVALAHMVSNGAEQGDQEGIVIGIDPAPLTYGAPFTLGQAQAALTKSELGKFIQWVQKDPVDYFARPQSPPIDYIVFAHSLFYLPSADYFAKLLRSAREAASPTTKLLLADWGMQTSVPKAEAHVLSVKAQLAFPDPESNVRTVLEPDAIKALAEKAGWKLESDSWIRSPELHDGEWEVANARKRVSEELASAEAKQLLKDMDTAEAKANGSVKCMDVWTSVWVPVS